MATTSDIWNLDNLRRLGTDPNSQFSPETANPAALYQNYVHLYGHEPTQDDIYRLAQSYSIDPGVGNQYLASEYSQYKQSPAYLATQASKFAPQVNQLFQSQLNRQATPQEISHFGALLAGGHTDPYELQSYIQATPEYQKIQDTNFRNDLGGQLQDITNKNFDLSKQNIISQYAQMGRSTSPALDAALTELSAQLGTKQAEYLAGVSASQYQGNKDLAIGNYKDFMGQNLNDTNNARDLATKNQQFYQGQVQDRSNYALKRGDYFGYLDYLKNSQPSHAGQTIGGLVGTVGGALIGGPAGGALGGAIGGGAGQTYDYLSA